MYVLCVGGKALGVADQDCPKKMVAVYVYCVLVVEPLVYLTKIT